MLTAHVTFSQTMKLCIDERHELVERRLIAGAPGQEQSRNILLQALVHSLCFATWSQEYLQYRTCDWFSLWIYVQKRIHPAAAFSSRFRLKRVKAAKVQRLVMRA